MNRRELVKAIAAHTATDVKKVDSILGGAMEVITAVVSQGETVSLPGFAKFTKVERPARMGRNPATGETIRIKASKRARITALKGFKEAVLSPSKAPKLARGVWPTDPNLLARQAAEAKAAAKAAAPARKAAGGTKRTATKKRAATKRATTKRAPAKKRTTAKRTAAKRATTRRPAARKATARRTTARGRGRR